jgi:predicted nucleic acid binding AN1-type Zn finger protein
MRIFVKTSAGQNFALEVESSDSVEVVRQKIQERGACVVDSIIFEGITLDPSSALASYITEKEATLMVTVKEEMPKSPVKCVAGCGFYGNPKTNNMCSKCFRTSTSAAASPAPTAPTPAIKVPVASTAPEITTPTPMEVTPTPTEEACTQKDLSRCWNCNKKVGLLGIKCRCGFTFCSSHRYPECHACDFDYKALQKTTLEMQNPVVVAPKVIKL